jgi:hypothetical protein
MYEITTDSFSYMQGCGLSIREDLLNKYAEDMVKYYTTGLDSTIQDTLASKINIMDMKEKQVRLESKIDSLCSELFLYREKHIALEKEVKGLHEHECKYRKYLKLFWLMVIIYVCC